MTVLQGVTTFSVKWMTRMSLLPQSGQLRVEPGRVEPSWAPAIEWLGLHSVRMGWWVAPGAPGTPMGVVAYVSGHGGTLSIGASEHDGRGYVLSGAPTYAVDCYLPAHEFDALVAALGVQRAAEALAGPPRVPLTRYRSPWNLVVSWFAVMGAVSVVAGLGGLLRVDRSALGTALLVSVLLAMVAGGIGLMVQRAKRVRLPELELRLEPDVLVLAHAGGHSITRVPWSAVFAEPLCHLYIWGRGWQKIPVLRLTFGSQTLHVGVWALRLDWPGKNVPYTGAPPWNTGAPHWQHLVDALRWHQRLTIPELPIAVDGPPFNR